MSAALLLALALSLPGRFTLDAIPLPARGAQALIIGVDADKTSDIAFLNGSELTVYPSKVGGPPIETALGPGTSAFDVANLDGDGNAEIVAVRGDSVVRIPIARDGPQPQAELFRRPSLLSAANVAPYPRVLVVRRGLRPLIALPQIDCVELLTLDGALDTRYPCATEQGQGGMRFRAFNAASAHGPLEWTCEQNLRVEPKLPVDLQPAGEPAARQRRGTPSQMIDAASKSPSYWPWFPLRSKGEDARRVLYAAAPPQSRDTLLRIARGTPSNDESAPAATPGEVGPAQTFPGMLLLPPEDLPDFNHDGYVDVAFWQAPSPSASFDSLFRAAAGGAWDIRANFYLYLPDEGRYSPTPVSVIRTQVPAPWFMPWDSWAPLRNLLFHDFNGDGYTDCGWSVANDRYVIWLYDSGFPSQPSFECTFPAQAQSIEFCADLNGDGATSVGFRAERFLFLLRWENDPK